MGLPPTMFMTDRQPTDGWTREDKKLAIAFTILQKETCNQCGQPIWICRSDNKNLGFKVKTAICYAKRELDKWGESARGKNIGKGEYAYIEAFMYSDEKLPSRDDWIKQEMEE